MKDLVSIIIPVYNAEKYLKECVDSALNQTYKDVEIVLINDGSKDNSQSVIEEYANKFDNVVFRKTENRGVSAARNLGLDVSNGKYIMFLDSDDSLPLDSVQTLYDNIKLMDADMSVGKFVGGGNYNIDGTIVWSGTEGLEKALLDDPYTYSSCAKLFSKEKFKSVRFTEGRKIHEDSFFVFECMVCEPKVVVSSYEAYCCRENLESASRGGFSDKFFDILYFADQKKKIVEEKYPELKDKAYNVLVKANIAMLQTLCNTKDKKYNPAIKDCIKTVKKYKKYFVPTYPKDKTRFNIIRFNLYRPYRFIYQIKFRERIK